MVVMTPRESWTDPRLDELAKRVDGRFDEIDRRFDAQQKYMDARFDALERTMQIGFGLIGGALAVIGMVLAALVGLIAT